MTSDLQRIAQGLLQYLDSNPRLAADLRSAGVVCRELAGAVGELTALIPAAAASAHYLDAAARSCDQAAHLATQATATGRAWALSTLGEGRATTATGRKDQTRASPTPAPSVSIQRSNQGR